MVNIWTTVKNFYNFLINFIINCFALAEPKYRVILISFCMLLLSILPFDKLYLLPTFSVFSKIGLYDFLGFEFYSVGMTRALSSFFHFNFLDAYNYNPLVFIFISILFIIYIKDIYLLFKYIKKSNLNEFSKKYKVKKILKKVK